MLEAKEVTAARDLTALVDDTLKQVESARDYARDRELHDHTTGGPWVKRHSELRKAAAAVGDALDHIQAAFS